MARLQVGSNGDAAAEYPQYQRPPWVGMAIPYAHLPPRDRMPMPMPYAQPVGFGHPAQPAYLPPYLQVPPGVEMAMPYAQPVGFGHPPQPAYPPPYSQAPPVVQVPPGVEMGMLYAHPAGYGNPPQPGYGYAPRPYVQAPPGVVNATWYAQPAGYGNQPQPAHSHAAPPQGGILGGSVLGALLLLSNLIPNASEYDFGFGDLVFDFSGLS